MGTADSMAIVSAVTECSMFLLVRNNKNANLKAEEDVEDLPMDLAQIFLDSLSYYLTTPSGGSASLLVENDLAATLIRDLFKLDTLSIDRTDCKFAQVRSWFWGEGMASAMEDTNRTAIRRLRSLLDGMVEVGDGPILSNEVSFRHSIRTHFWDNILPQCRASPRLEHLSLMASVFKFCTISFVFRGEDESSEQSIDAFCRDTLVPWIRLPSSVTNQKSLQKVVFDLLFMIMSDVEESERTQIWENCLREIAKEVKDLDTVTIGVSLLATRYTNLVDTLQCQTFDDFAIMLANHSENKYRSHAGTGDSNEQHAESELSFLCLSAGLNGNSSKTLARPAVIHSWVDIALSYGLDYGVYKERHVLLETLLCFARTCSTVIDSETLLNVVLRVWKEGGPTWSSKDLEHIFASDDNLRCKLLSSCSDILKDEVKGGELFMERDDVDFSSYLWGER